MKPPVVIDSRCYDAVVFDLDGVVTDTASIHAKAWATMFDDFLNLRPSHEGENHSHFTSDDYRHFVDGKSRDDGVTDFLASRGISLDHGSSADDAMAETVCGLGNRKQELFLRLLADGVPVFDSTIALVRHLTRAGLATAVYSASRNCKRVLAAAGIEDLFPVRVDGIVAAELGLSGKPDPAVLLETARRLHVPPDRCVVIEDAEAGVAAGRNGGFGLVIGIDRTGHRNALVERGADAVVSDLADVAVCTPDEANDHVLLLDGTEIAVRRLSEHDVDSIVDLHQQLTDRELYLRFFTMHPGQLEEFARKLVQATVGRCALGAFENGQLIGVSNYVVAGDSQSAEIAVTVAHEDHLRGVATTLLRLLGSAARSHGIRWLVADVLAENTDMLQVLSGTGWQRTQRFDGAVLTVRIDLNSTEDYSPIAK